MTLPELIHLARTRSEFYRKLYQALPASVQSLDQLPVLDQNEFWKCNELKSNTVLTGPMHDGVVFKSGGTTGSPKFSVFSKKEWEDFTKAFGRGMALTGLEAGDRVANLFYVGQLYGSLLFINKSLEESPLDVLQFPIGGTTDLAETAQLIRDFEMNVIAGVPTTIMNLAEFIHKNGFKAKDFKVKTILFGGEAFYPDQRSRLLETFPGVQIRSIGYASTDAGLIGYADSSCGPTEHRVFSNDTVLELIDEATGKAIEEIGQEGLIVVTNLTRSLMPIIRYPVGDRGKWLEPRTTSDRKYALLGRSEEAARVGLVKLYVEDVGKILETFRAQLGIVGFQLLVIHRDRKDGLIIRIATSGGGSAVESSSQKINQEIIGAIHKNRPLYEEFVQDSKIHPIELQWISNDQLEVNPRTGKMKRVIDNRFTP